MMKYGVLSLTFLLLFVLINNVSSDNECIYTDLNGNFCNCDGTNENCLVAAITWEKCGDEASELHVRLNICTKSHVKEKKDKKKVAYKQICANGDVARQWYTEEDCTGAVSKVEKLSAQYQECATITCVGADARESTSTDIISIANINNITITIFIILTINTLFI